VRYVKDGDSEWQIGEEFMRPHGKAQLDSLYFRYPHFDAKPVAELEGSDARHSVAIVGAGPIGMTAALALARYGVRSVLLDNKSTFNDGSRAICVARPSMHILDRIGAGKEVVDKALGWRYGRSYYRNKQIYRLEMPHSEQEKYLPMYNLQQQYIEQYLYNAVERCDLIDVRWQSEVLGLVQTPEGVTLNVTSPLGDYAVSADYVLAADGARSSVRSLMGLRLKGENYEGKYVIADIRMRHDFPTERRAYFDPTCNPGGTVLIHRQPDDIWRIDYQLRDGDSEDEAIKEHNIRERVQAILDSIGHAGGWELEWWSIYSANTLCLDDYKHGRVIFVGDSAHVVPIFGVRGLNSGLADAYNAAWKLAYVIRGDAKPELLDSYTPERRGATLDVFANATKSARFMTPPTRGWKLAREAALSLALDHNFTRGFVNPRQMEPYTYSNSPLTVHSPDAAEFGQGPLSGSAAPNARANDGRFLLDLVGDGFAAILFCERSLTRTEMDMLAVLRKLDRRFVVLTVAMRGSKVEGAVVEDRDGTIATIYGAGPGTLYLLRPDLHIAARWRVANAADVVVTMQRCLGGAS
jgi:3-(3-hydroxy-phenyl)propionate hydroxylase